MIILPSATFGLIVASVVFAFCIIMVETSSYKLDDGENGINPRDSMGLAVVTFVITIIFSNIATIASFVFLTSKIR